MKLINQNKMTHTIIKTDNYLLIVDDSEVNIGDYYLRYNESIMKCTGIDIKFNEALNKEETIISSEGCGDPYERSKDYIKKIIAHLPLNGSPILEGVDLLPPLENDNDYLDGCEVEFANGFRKAKEKYKWTDEDVIKIVEKSRETGLTAEYLILSLSEPKYPITFEQGNVIDGKNYISVTRRHDEFTLWIGKYIY